MVDKEQIESVLGRLPSVEAEMGDPAVLSDRKRYRAVLDEYSFLKKLDYAWTAYQLEEATEQEVLAALLPPDPLERRNAVMEIRAGTGGEEAALFAGDLFRMYSRYAERQGWKIETMNTSPAAAGGLKEIIFSIQGEAVYSHMKYEAGVHRVQRVPETETQGRIHTSAASVVVLPEQEEVTVDIKPEDLRIDIYRSTGAGGQHVNTTDSAIRITHLPTGLVVTCQDERSQYKNKAKAMRVLQARLLEKERQDAAKERSDQRKTMVGSGDRSDKVRTYNFPQNRVTDHRIGLTVHALGEIMDGDLDRLILPLIEHECSKKASRYEKIPFSFQCARASLRLRQERLR